MRAAKDAGWEIASCWLKLEFKLASSVATVKAGEVEQSAYNGDVEWTELATWVANEDAE